MLRPVSAFAPSTPATHFSAGVQTMRARICSAFSCDMFARVVWLKSWGAAKPPTFALPFTARTCHARFARLTRARGKSSQREGNALFDDFWYFWSRKSTIKEKFLYVSSRANDVRPYHDPKCRQQPKEKSNLHSLFLLQNQAQKKKLSKRKRRNKLSRSAEHDHRCRWTPPPFEKGGRKL